MTNCYICLCHFKKDCVTWLIIYLYLTYIIFLELSRIFCYIEANCLLDKTACVIFLVLTKSWKIYNKNIVCNSTERDLTYNLCICAMCYYSLWKQSNVVGYLYWIYSKSCFHQHVLFSFGLAQAGLHWSWKTNCSFCPINCTLICGAFNNILIFTVYSERVFNFSCPILGTWSVEIICNWCNECNMH